MFITHQLNTLLFIVHFQSKGCAFYRWQRGGGSRKPLQWWSEPEEDLHPAVDHRNPPSNTLLLNMFHVVK